MRVLIILSAVLGIALCATKPPPSGVCVSNGVTYHNGESFQPSPCEHCFCQHGQPVCAIADCFVTPCVDSIHDPTKCCPVCPNGENCQHKDGTIIKKGDTYSPNAHTICQCPDNSFMFGGPVAICAVQAQTMQPVVMN